MLGGGVVDSMVGEKSIDPIVKKPQIVETRHSKGHGMIFFVHRKRITQNTIQYNTIIS